MAGIELINGFRKVVFWTINDVEAHAQRYSQSYRKYKKSGNKNDAIWALQFDQMAEKTLLKLINFKIWNHVDRYATSCCFRPVKNQY